MTFSEEPSSRTSGAVVLGPGGLVGTAWLAGMVTGLRDEGVRLADADLIVGTSAGAIVGAALATGQDLAGFHAPARPAPRPGDEAAAPQVDQGRLGELFAVMSDPGLEPAEARRRVGRRALSAAVVSEEAVLAQMGALITARRWPERALLITAVDVETGEPVIWDGASGAPLLSAVASSCAAPGAYPPITINGRRYMDGALAGGSNTHLAAGPERLVVLEPMPMPMPPAGGAGDGPEAAEGADDVTTVRLAPDPESLAAFGAHPFDRTAWSPAFAAGRRQGGEAAGRVGEVWSGSASMGR